MEVFHQQVRAVRVTRVLHAMRAFWAWPIAAVVAMVALVGAPGPLHHTAHQVLHGLCAQQPSHSFFFGDHALPFDARMTGIYGGLMVAFCWFAFHGRLRGWGIPPRSVIALLVTLVGLMAVDGTNSLLVDLQLWHPYPPTNVGRLLTGLGAGVAMASLLAWLFATSVWASGQPRAAVRSLRELGEIGVFLIPYVIAILLAPEVLYHPMSILLLFSAWTTLTALMLIVVVLSIRRDGTFVNAHQFHGPVLGASVLALALMVGLAGARYWLERMIGLPATM